MARRLPGPKAFSSAVAASGRHAFRPDHDGLADFGIYVAILATIGWVPAAVTTNLNINFLKMPAARDLLGEARLLKVGRRLAVAEIGMRSDGEEELVAHATGTYAIPAVK